MTNGVRGVRLSIRIGGGRCSISWALSVKAISWAFSGKVRFRREGMVGSSAVVLSATCRVAASLAQLLPSGSLLLLVSESDSSSAPRT